MADKWIVWGHILRTAGKYKSARHKFEKALKYDPTNQAAKYELKIVENLIYFDKMLPTDATLRMRQPGLDMSTAGQNTNWCNLF